MGSFSGENSAHHVGFFHAGELAVEAAERVGEPFVVDAQDLEHRGVQVAEVDRVLGDVVAKVVGATELDAGLHASAGQPNGEAAPVVVAAHVGVAQRALAKNSTPEFSEEHNERVFEEAALFHVLKQGSGGLVDVATLVRELPLDRNVLVPAAVKELDEADTALQ